MRTERTLDRRTANKLSSKRIRERCNYFFLSPTLSLSLFSPSSCLRVARREETTAKVVPFAESFRPGRLITILVKETFFLVEEEDTRREKRKEKKEEARTPFEFIPIGFSLKVTPRILFSPFLAKSHTRHRSNL